VQSEGKFASLPKGKDDKLRQCPATIRMDPQNMGLGTRLSAHFRAFDKDGN